MEILARRSAPDSPTPAMFDWAWALAFSAFKSLWVFGTFLTTIDGENIEDGNMIVLGTTWTFATPFAS